MAHPAGTEAEQIRALLVDDEESDFEITRALLSQAQRTVIELDWVTSYRDALDVLGREQHDVYLVDYFLEDHTGLDFIREVVRRDIGAPVIMLTGRGNHAVDLEAMRAGAADYLVKGRIDPDLLERSIRYALERTRAAEALRESEARHRSTFDHLPVGLYRSAPDGRFIDANPALRKILGYPDDEMLQHGYSRDLFVNPTDSGKFLETLREKGTIRGFQTRLRKIDGTELEVRNSAWVHRTQGSEIQYIEGTVELLAARPATGTEPTHPRPDVTARTNVELP